MSDRTYMQDDPVVSEVRAIRREVCESVGNDVGLLCEHLQEVERDFQSRTGVFSTIAQPTLDSVIASWERDATHADPLIDDVRKARRSVG